MDNTYKLKRVAIATLFKPPPSLRKHFDRV